MRRKRPPLNRLDRSLCVATGLVLRGYRLLDLVDSRGRTLLLGPQENGGDLSVAALYHVDPAGRVYARFGLADPYPVALSGSTSWELWRVGSTAAAEAFSGLVVEQESAVQVESEPEILPAAPARPWWQFDEPGGAQDVGEPSEASTT